MDDVIVVGAGPAGNNAALGLASRGYAVTVIDFRQNIGDKLCTGIVGLECARRFPIDPSLIYREPRSAQVFTPGAPEIRFEAATPQARIVDRAGYVASFARKAHDAGARYVLGQRVLQIAHRSGGLTITTDGDSYQTRSLVLATGFGSPLTRQLGLGTVSDYVTGAQAVVSTSGVDDVEVHLGRDVAPGFFCWVVPTLEGQALIGLLARRGAPLLLSGFIQRQRQQGKVTGVICKATAWGIPLRPLRRTYQDRVLVVGDAAGQVKPTTGGGIYYSLLASEIAAQALGEALAADDLSAARLGHYQHRWKRVLSQELEVGYSARRLFEFLTDQQIASLVEQASVNGFRAELVNSSDIGFDWHSRTIAKVLAHPVLGGALRVINPLLARLARPSDMSYGATAASGSLPGTVTDTPD